MAIFDDNKGLCPNCNNHSGFALVEGYRVWPPVPDRQGNDDQPCPGVPGTESPELDATVLEPIRSLYREASECRNAGAFRGAGVLYRAAVEELVKDQGGTGRNLHDRIENLRGKPEFPGQLVDDGDAVRPASGSSPDA